MFGLTRQAARRAREPLFDCPLPGEEHRGEDDDSTRAPRRSPFRIFTMLRIGIGIAVAQVFAILAVLTGQIQAPHQPVTPRPVPQAPPPEWAIVRDAPAPFAWDAPALAGAPRLHEAREHRGGGGRIDVVVAGTFPDTGSAHARLVIRQPGPEAIPPVSFFVELAREAAQAGVAVLRSTQPDAITTRFGPVIVNHAVLRGQGVERACLAFQPAAGNGPLRLSGWWCGAESAPASPRDLACALTHLRVVEGVADPQLRGLLAAPDPSRGRACAAAPTSESRQRTSLLGATAPLPPRREASR
jgi:hypothetical protein